MGFVILSAFSSTILFTTIHTSVYVIDSLEELIASDLIPLVHMSEIEISQIEVNLCQYL